MLKDRGCGCISELKNAIIHFSLGASGLECRYLHGSTGRLMLMSELLGYKTSSACCIKLLLWSCYVRNKMPRK